MIRKLAFKSLAHRRLISLLLVFLISLSVILFLTVERTRLGVRESFNGALSKTDLVVGARGGPLSLLLYSVFHIGNATNNISYSSFEYFRDHAAVEWVIPYSLGDSHHGFRVVGTDQNFYKHFRFHGNRQIEFADGKEARETFDIVLGSKVAESLHYKIGDSIVLSHGASDSHYSAYDHSDKPFAVVGILKRTDTPVDGSLYITLSGMEAIHIDWKDGAPPSSNTSLKTGHSENLKIHSITSFLLRAKNRVDSLFIQREVNDFAAEPLMAIIPGVVMGEVWNSFSYLEVGFQVVSWVVALASLVGLFLALILSTELRRREMAILRAIGLSVRSLFKLIIFETLVLTLTGIVIGVGFVFGGFYLLRGEFEAWTGLVIPIIGLTFVEGLFLCSLVAMAMCVAIYPALRTFRNALSDGLKVE